MSDEIIDLSRYREQRRAGTAFAVAGGKGERSYLALPVWRATYLLGGERGGILWAPPEGGALRPLFVLDLAEEPARTGFGVEGASRLQGSEPPAVDLAEGAVTILLARQDERTWFLVVAGREVGASEPDSGTREDLLFVAGECAGLLMHRGLSPDE